MRELDLLRLHCYRCVYTWTPHKSPVRMCPRCKSRLWDQPKIRPLRLGKGLGVEEVLGGHRKQILKVARRFGVGKIRVFGSVRRRQATVRSDVDLLVSWTRKHSLLDRADFLAELERIIGHRVDLVNEGGLHWAVAPQVEAEAVPL